MLEPIVITHADTAHHEAFLRFVPRVFPSISFRAWHTHGGWDERYTVCALFEHGEIVASASLFQMDLVLEAKRVRGFQLGAVGTLPEYRGRGLQRRVMERVLRQTEPQDVVFLFANHSVLDFYPRFGFTRAREHVFRTARTVTPRGEPLRALDLDAPLDRALLQRIARLATPVTECFGARDYGSIVLWYWCNFFPRALRYAPELDAIVIADQERELLRLYDVLAANTLDLDALLPRLIDAPIATVELGFTPERYFTDAQPVVEYIESPLYVRGPHPLPREPFKYPLLAQT